jgi:hypothetical protein
MDWVKHDLLKNVVLNKVLSVFPIFLVQFGKHLIQEMSTAMDLLKDSKFRENLCSVNCTLITNLNGYLTIISTCNI